jgi:hypothetical protein
MRKRWSGKSKRLLGRENRGVELETVEEGIIGIAEGRRRGSDSGVEQDNTAGSEGWESEDDERRLSRSVAF